LGILTETIDEVPIKLIDKSIVITAGGMLCKGCLPKIDAVLKKSGRNAETIYFLFDSKTIRFYERQTEIYKIREVLKTKNVEFIFLSFDSESTFTAFNGCADESRSPNVFLMNGNLIKPLCFDYLFSDSIGVKEINHEIKKFYAQKNN